LARETAISECAPEELLAITRDRRRSVYKSKLTVCRQLVQMVRKWHSETLDRYLALTETAYGPTFQKPTSGSAEAWNYDLRIRRIPGARKPGGIKG